MSRYNGPDWSSLDTKPAEKPDRVPQWIQTLFHWFMMLLLQCIIFVIGGVILLFLIIRKRPHNLSSEAIWIILIVGGTAAVIAWAYCMRRKIPPYP